MTEREKEIQNTKREIERLNVKLKKLESLPSKFDENEELLNIEDFPVKGVRLNRLKQNAGIETVYDLIHSSPEKILSIRDCGIGCLQKIKDWMNEHNIMFID